MLCPSTTSASSPPLAPNAPSRPRAPAGRAPAATTASAPSRSTRRARRPCARRAGRTAPRRTRSPRAPPASPRRAAAGRRRTSRGRWRSGRARTSPGRRPRSRARGCGARPRAPRRTAGRTGGAGGRTQTRAPARAADRSRPEWWARSVWKVRNSVGSWSSWYQTGFQAGAIARTSASSSTANGPPARSATCSTSRPGGPSSRHERGRRAHPTSAEMRVRGIGLGPYHQARRPTNFLRSGDGQPSVPAMARRRRNRGCARRHPNNVTFAPFRPFTR